MKKVLLGVSTIFTILAFAGAGYVLSIGGQANAGFAVIPMLFALVVLMTGFALILIGAIVENIAINIL